MALSLAKVGTQPAVVTQSTRKRRLSAAVPFVELGGKNQPFTQGQVRCRAEIEGRRLRVLVNTFRGDKAFCAWRLPKGVSGKALVGVVAIQVGKTALPRVFVRPLR